MNYRRLLLVAGLTATVAASFGLDFESSGETLGSLFPKLSKETGMTLRLNGDVTNEVVIIKAKDVEPVELLQKIADATGLVWTQEEGGYRLSRNFEIDQKAQIEFRDYTTNSLKQWQQNPPPTSGSPVDEIMMAMPPEYLANVTIGGRIVFADRNNRNQTAMSNNVRSLATAIIAEQNQMRIDALQAAYDKRPDDRIKAFINSAKQPQSKIILVVRRNSLNSWSLTLQALDSNGGARFSFSGSYATSEPTLTGTNPLANWNLPEGDPAQQSLKLISGSSENLNAKATLLKYALDPVNNEPISMAIGPALLASAPDKQNFVACIPDEFVDQIATSLTFQGPSGLNGTGVTAKKDEQGWVIISPTLKIHNWDTRRDRAALKLIMNKLATAGILSLNDQADYAKTVSSWYSTSSFEFNLARKAIGASISRELTRMTGAQIEGLAIYNALRSKMTMQNEVKSIKDLQRPFVTFTVFNSPAEPTAAPIRTQTQTGTQVFSGVQVSIAQPAIAQQRGGPQTFQFRGGQERTELYSAGLPLEGQINIGVRSQDSYVVRAIDNSAQSVMSERDLINLRASQMSQNIRPSGGILSTSNNNFGATRSTTITFQIVFADGTSFTRTVSGTEAPKEFVQYNGISQQVLERVEKQAIDMATRANERGQNQRGSRRGGGTPPPMN
jgi:hypothetical protein